MAFHIKYHRLFEVNILHEYYLLGEGDPSFYGLAAEDRKTLFDKRLLAGQYKLMNDLEIVPTENTRRLLKNRKLKLVQTFSGFTVAGQGEATTLSGGGSAIKPTIPLNDNLELTFIIKVKNPFFKNYTSLPLRRPQQEGYFFTNSMDNVNGTHFFSLSKPAPTFVAGNNYTSGEIAAFGGILREATANTDNAANWDNIEADGYVNESDRILLPKLFRHNPTADEVGGAFTFVLKKPDGSEVKTIEVDNASDLGIRVDFSSVKEDLFAPPVPIKDGYYDLDITSPSGTQTKRIYLHSEYVPATAGMIHIQFNETGPGYRVLGSEGELLIPYPIFEIRYRSRRTFWRYSARQTSKKLKLISADVAAHFFNDANVDASDSMETKFLVTKTPQKLTLLPFGVTGGSAPAQLLPQPQPSPLMVKKTEELGGEPPGRFYSEIALASVASKIKVI